MPTKTKIIRYGGPFFKGPLLRWLGVTRERDPPVILQPLGFRAVLNLRYESAMLRAAPNTSPERLLSSVRYGVTRASGEKPVVKMGV